MKTWVLPPHGKFLRTISPIPPLRRSTKPPNSQLILAIVEALISADIPCFSLSSGWL
jgi:hypothetical protein